MKGPDKQGSESVSYKILFLCQHFYPESSSSASLPFDTARWLVQRGYQVDVLCGMPNEDGVPSGETVDGVHITRLNYARPPKRSKLGRIFVYFSFVLKVLLRIKKLERYDVIFVYSNPPVLPAAALLPEKLWGTKVVFICYDVYPEIAVRMGSISPNGLISRLMTALNRRLARKVDAVVALTEEMRQLLLTRRPGLTGDRVRTIHNWAHEETLPENGNAVSVRNQYGIPTQAFVVSYIGNMGICQDMHTILDAAQRLKPDDNIRFLLVGDGVKKPEILRHIQQKSLTNIILLNTMPPEDCTRLQRGSDCCIVSLEPGLGGLCAPSKYQSCLYAGKPILMIADDDFCFCREIRREQAGIIVRPGSADTLASQIQKMAADRYLCEYYGRHARALYDIKYTYTAAMQLYAELLTKIDEENASCGY